MHCQFSTECTKLQIGSKSSANECATAPRLSPPISENGPAVCRLLQAADLNCPTCKQIASHFALRFIAHGKCLFSLSQTCCKCQSSVVSQIINHIHSSIRLHELVKDVDSDVNRALSPCLYIYGASRCLFLTFF